MNIYITPENTKPGKRHNRWTVMEYEGYVDKQPRLKCVCDCGIVRSCRALDVIKGASRSCGCLKTEEKKAPRVSIIAGDRFGRWTVSIANYRQDEYGYWLCLCRCSCGMEREVASSRLKRGSTASCGCLARERSSLAHRKHGDSTTPEYKAWCSMIGRCSREGGRDFKDYAGRGIKVCDEWIQSYDVFLSSVGRRPSSYHSLDRVDVNGNYEPNNVRWATLEEQCNNRRTNHHVKLNGVTKTLTEWCRELKFKPSVVSRRLKRGYTPYEALLLGWKRSGVRGQKFEYKGEWRTVPDWARLYGMSLSTLRRRLKSGMAVDAALETPIRGRIMLKEAAA